MMTSRFAILAMVATAVLPGAALADRLVALSGDATLTPFDATTLAAGPSVTVTGVEGRIAGIDMRPSDGQLYALAVDGKLYTVDPATGRATFRVQLATMLKPGVMATMDFNPAADRLRVIGSDGTSLRIHPDEGTVITDKPLNYAAGDPHAGRTPMVTAGAYSRNLKGTRETTLFDIDSATGAFLRQVPPNDGVLNTLGNTGLTGTIAFDIASEGSEDRGWIVAGDSLYRVDLANGQTRRLGAVRGLPAGVRDIAVLPR